MAKETLASQVRTEDIIISNEEINIPNYLIDDEYLEVYAEYADEFIEECERRRLEKERR